MLSFLILHHTLLSCINPFPIRQILDSSKLKEFANDNFEFDESSPKWLKTLWEKEKLLVTSNFSFSHSVFKTCTADM